MFENLERLTVVTIQPLLGGEPHEPFAVLDDVKNRILRQSFIGGQMTEGNILSLSFYDADNKKTDKKEVSFDNHRYQDTKIRNANIRFSIEI